MNILKTLKQLIIGFIVICNRTRVPLVWEWFYTKTTVDFKIGDIEFLNWRGIVKQA